MRQGTVDRGRVELTALKQKHVVSSTVYLPLRFVVTQTSQALPCFTHVLVPRPVLQRVGGSLGTRLPKSHSSMCEDYTQYHQCPEEF